MATHALGKEGERDPSPESCGSQKPDCPFSAVRRKLRISLVEMAARAGIEPASVFLQAALAALGSESGDAANAQYSAQFLRELAEVASAWAKLPPEIRFAVVALVRTGGRQ